jgi:hypothetical protein
MAEDEAHGRDDGLMKESGNECVGEVAVMNALARLR